MVAAASACSLRVPAPAYPFPRSRSPRASTEFRLDSSALVFPTVPVPPSSLIDRGVSLKPSRCLTQVRCIVRDYHRSKWGSSKPTWCTVAQLDITDLYFSTSIMLKLVPPASFDEWDVRALLVLHSCTRMVICRLLFLRSRQSPLPLPSPRSSRCTPTQFQDDEEH